MSSEGAAAAPSLLGKPSRSLLLPGVPGTSPGVPVTFPGDTGVCCRVCKPMAKAAPCRSAGTPPSSSHPSWWAVGWAQGCSPQPLAGLCQSRWASQIHLGGGFTGLRSWGEPTATAWHQKPPRPSAIAPRQAKEPPAPGSPHGRQFGTPRTHHHGCPVCRFPAGKQHPSAPTCVRLPPARMDEESRG